MNYLVIDLEMCKVPQLYRNKTYKYAHEIIQVGAVLLDQEFKQIATLCQYVRPQYGVLDHFISQFTGIQNKQLKYAPILEEVLKHMIHWIGKREYQVFAWSDNDYWQLEREIRCKNIEDEQVMNFMDRERWIDYQSVFVNRYEFTRAIGLDEALLLCDIEPDGRFHNGLDDAINTAKIIEKLEMNPEYQILNREKEATASAEPLKFCIGDLFAKLELACVEG